MSEKGLLKNTFIITFCSILGIVINFVLQLVIAYYFGASFERDAYFAAIAIPTYLSAIFTGSIGMVFLPKFVDIQQNEGDKQAIQFLRNTLGLTFLLTLFIVVLFTVFSKQILSITAPGFDESMLSSTRSLLIILLPTFLFQIGTTILSSILQINSIFFKPAIAPVIGIFISLIIVVLFSTQIGIKSLAYGSLISSFVAFFIVYHTLNKSNIKIKLKFNFNNHNINALIIVSLPLFLGGIVFRLMPVFERMIASKLPQGSISYLGYANQLLTILATIISSGIATTFFPKMSKAFSLNDMNLLRNSFEMAIISILLVILPISVIFYIYGVSIIQILLERGAFTHEITLAVYSTFVFLLGAFIFQSLGNIVMRVLYLSKKTVWASIIALIEISCYLFGGMWLCNLYSYKGLAIAQSFSTGLTILFSMIIICKLLFKFNASFFISSVKILFSNITFLLFLAFVNTLWNDNDSIIIIFLKISIGLILLSFLLYIFKIQEIIKLKNIVQFKVLHKLKK
jgi:putative peptidoglycan lipid II flippase